MATILKARRMTRRRCWCRGPRTGPLCDACVDREARNRRAASETLVRYVLWPEMYVEDGEAGAWGLLHSNLPLRWIGPAARQASSWARFQRFLPPGAFHPRRTS